MIRYISDLYYRFKFQSLRNPIPKWSGQSIEELLEMHLQHRVDLLLIPMIEALCAKESQGLALSEAEITVLSINALEGQVNNGGFIQFFQNRSNEYAGRIIQDLITIGCNNTAKIVADAIECLELTDLSPEAITHKLDLVGESVFLRLEKLDDKFFSYPDDIATKLFQFVATNKAEFQLVSRNISKT